MAPDPHQGPFDRDGGNDMLQRAVGQALELHGTVRNLGDPASCAAVDQVLLELGRLLARRLEPDA